MNTPDLPPTCFSLAYIGQMTSVAGVLEPPPYIAQTHHRMTHAAHALTS